MEADQIYYGNNYFKSGSGKKVERDRKNNIFGEIKSGYLKLLNSMLGSEGFHADRQ